MKILYLLLFSTLAISVNAQTTWTVMNTLDDGTTTTAGTLRKAINDASDGDIIRFDPALISSGSATLIFNSQIAFSKSLLIKGLYNSTDTLFFSGNNSFRHFEITNTGNVTLDSLVLINGVYASGLGGAIHMDNSGTLFINNSIIRDNLAGASGGGIFSSSPVIIENSTLSRNTSSNGQGGGIYSTGAITVMNSTVSGNMSVYGFGGGVFSTTTITILNSTISGNTSRNDGGGIISKSSNSTSVTVENSTISDNISTSGSGGGIFSSSVNSTSTVSIKNSTIYGNTASFNGQGVFSTANNLSVINITSSIIFSNGINIYNDTSAINSFGYNIFSDLPYGVDIATDLTYVSNPSLNLLPLAFNGGTTKTMLPGCGSIALNGGNPIDFSDAQNGAITDGVRDVGAVEGVTSTTKTVQNLSDAGIGSLRQVIADACPNDTIRFNPTLLTPGNATLTLTSEIAFSKPLVIIGLYNGADTLFISGGNTNHHFNITNTGNVTLDSLVLINGFNSGDGGAVSMYNVDALFVKNSVIIGNTSSNGSGGAISSNSTSASAITIENSTISRNSASFGGGINFASNYANSTITVENSTISDNDANKGGGISSYAYSSLITVKNSTISGNNASNNAGGGIFSYAPGSVSFTVENSTISGNTSGTNGSGIYSESTSATSTIEVTSSIIWSNSANNIYNNGLTTIFTSNGNNIFSDSPLGAVASDSINVSNTSLNLLPLAFNGGTTQTMLPGAGSIAIDAGNIADLTDAQNNSISGRRDIGAAERFSVTNTETKTACSSYSWRDAVTYTADTLGAKFTLYSNVIAIADTIFTLDLTINQPTTGDTTATACGSFTWFGTNYTTSGTPTHLFPNGSLNGCDSTVTLNLTINQPTTGDTTATACGSFEWFGTNYTASGTPTHLFPNGSENGCDSTVTLNLTINNVDPTATQNGKNLSATATGATYQWINCNNNSPISGATSKDYLATADGSYAVIVTKNGCSDTSTCLVVNTTGLNDLSGISGVKIYPNPTKVLITVQIENMQTGDHIIELLDATGRVLKTSKMNQNTETISLLNFENGMYIIRISNGNNQTIQRIIKE